MLANSIKSLLLNTNRGKTEVGQSNLLRSKNSALALRFNLAPG
jgi:hypothetical protein